MTSSTTRLITLGGLGAGAGAAATAGAETEAGRLAGRAGLRVVALFFAAGLEEPALFELRFAAAALRGAAFREAPFREADGLRAAARFFEAVFFDEDFFDFLVGFLPLAFFADFFAAFFADFFAAFFFFDAMNVLLIKTNRFGIRTF